MYYQYTLERFMEFSSRVIENVVTEETLEEIENYSQKVFDYNIDFSILSVLKEYRYRKLINKDFLCHMLKVGEVHKLHQEGIIDRLEYKNLFTRALEESIFVLDEEDLEDKYYSLRFYCYSDGGHRNLFRFIDKEGGDCWSVLYKIEEELKDIEKRMKIHF